MRRGEIGTPTVTYSELTPFSARSDEKKPGRLKLSTYVPPVLGSVRNSLQFRSGRRRRRGRAGLRGESGADSFGGVTDQQIRRTHPVQPHPGLLSPGLGRDSSAAAQPRTSFFSGHGGCDSYATEELIAELGSAFLSAEVGLAAVPRVHHAQYIASWLRVLKTDTRAVFLAAGRAAEAAAFLLPPGDHDGENPSS